MQSYMVKIIQKINNKLLTGCLHAINTYLHCILYHLDLVYLHLVYLVLLPYFPGDKPHGV